MNHWLANSKKNLLPLSKAADFTDALREWFFTGNVSDYEVEEADIHCELCEHSDLAHHFHIRNTLTGHSLLVGSSCILKFQEIEVRDKHGRVIADPELRKAALDEALRSKIIETSLQPLRALWRVSRNRRNLMEFFAREIKRNEGLSPKQLSDLLKTLERHQIPYAAKLYKISLRTNDAKSTVTSMSARDFERIAPALSKLQAERAMALRRERQPASPMPHQT